jgi:hypothetical protein
MLHETNLVGYTPSYRLTDRFPPRCRRSGRTYRYFTGEPLWPFGFGLTYSNLTVSTASPPAHATSVDDVISASVQVTNAGLVPTDDVVMVYLAPVDISYKNAGPMVIRQLVDFARLGSPLAPGDTTTIDFSWGVKDLLKLVDGEGDWILAPGHYELRFCNGAGRPPAVMDVLWEGDEVLLEKFPALP